MVHLLRKNPQAAITSLFTNQFQTKWERGQAYLITQECLLQGINFLYCCMMYHIVVKAYSLPINDKVLRYSLIFTLWLTSWLDEWKFTTTLISLLCCQPYCKNLRILFYIWMHCFLFVCNNFVKRFSFSHEMLQRLIVKKKAQLPLCVWLSSHSIW